MYAQGDVVSLLVLLVLAGDPGRGVPRRRGRGGALSRGAGGLVGRPDRDPTAEVSLNTGAGAWHRLEVVAASALEVRVRSRAYLKDSRGNPSVSRQVEVTWRRAGAGFPQAAIFGANGVQMDSNARVDSYDSSRGRYAVTKDVNGHVGKQLVGN